MAEEWKFDRVPLVLNDSTVCLMHIVQFSEQCDALFYARADHGGDVRDEHRKTAAAMVKALSPWLSTSLIWSLREELAAEILRVNEGTPRRTDPHPIDRPAA